MNLGTLQHWDPYGSGQVRGQGIAGWLDLIQSSVNLPWCPDLPTNQQRPHHCQYEASSNIIHYHHPGQLNITNNRPRHTARLSDQQTNRSWWQASLTVVTDSRWPRPLTHWPLGDDLVPEAVADCFVADQCERTRAEVKLELDTPTDHLCRHVVHLHTGHRQLWLTAVDTPTNHLCRHVAHLQTGHRQLWLTAVDWTRPPTTSADM